MTQDAAAPLLELRGVRAAYGSIEVLHGVDLVVPPASVVALLGPNGAGKTTTLSVACGLMSPTAGSVHVAGRDVTGVPPEVLAQKGLTTIPEGRGIFPNLTVRENLQMATLAGVGIKQVEEVAYGRFPRLAERRNQIAGTMSGGEQQMLALARALMLNPDLLMLDEPSMGLSPRLVEEVFATIARLKERKITMLLVEQFAAAALEVADYGYVLENGNISTSGPAARLRDDPAVKAAYLGAAH
jgi:branched-chain amino acid transport system ATP-binding protein